jgi:Ca2+-binding RTX toxin-like protein
VSGITSISGGSGTHQVVTVYGNGSVIAGNGNDTITVTGKGHITVGGGNDWLGLGNGGTITELGKSGHDTISLGNTNDTINVQGTAVVTGPLALFGLFGSATVSGGELDVGQTNHGALKVTVASGHATISGGFVPTKMVGGTGATDMKGGWGPDTFMGGSGADTMVGGHGSNLFEFLDKEAGGTRLIKNLVSGEDQLYLEGKSLSFLEKAVDVTTKAGNPFITLDGGHTQTELQGTTSLKPWDVTTHKS